MWRKFMHEDNTFPLVFIPHGYRLTPTHLFVISIIDAASKCTATH